MVDHNKTNSSHKAAIAGPLTFSHQGSGLVSHNVFGDFELDQRYSVWVLVETTAGSSESKRYYFSEFTYCSLAKEGPWAVHLTFGSDRGVGQH